MVTFPQKISFFSLLDLCYKKTELNYYYIFNFLKFVEIAFFSIIPSILSPGPQNPIYYLGHKKS
jgi:hypothetical protein